MANQSWLDAIHATYSPQYYRSDAVQEAALIQLYNDTNGSGWSSKENWLNTGMSYCLRAGVSCNYASNITALDLSARQMS